jgi:hypothetical protein
MIIRVDAIEKMHFIRQFVCTRRYWILISFLYISARLDSQTIHRLMVSVDDCRRRHAAIVPSAGTAASGVSICSIMHPDNPTPIIFQTAHDPAC